MTANEQEAIRFENIDYTVQGLSILNDITGSFPEGKITTLVGPSGAGKTTLFRLCNGLKSPGSGNIFIAGDDITDYEPVTLRRTVGMAMQQATMMTGSVQNNLELPLSLQGKTMEQTDAEAYLRLVGLEDVDLDKDSKDLSGGQRQKLSLARTLVNEPDILLLDEITSSLDNASRQTVEALIAKINRESGTTVIWITHSIEQAMRVGSHSWVMMDGRLVETGTMDILKHPENDRVRRFVEGDEE